MTIGLVGILWLFYGSILGQPIIFKSDSIYVGRVRIMDSPIAQQFNYQVVADSVEITTISTDCACTITEGLDVGMWQVGKKGKVTISFDAYKAGNFNKKTRIAYKLGVDTGSIFLTIAGYIEPFDAHPLTQFPYSIGKLRSQSKNINLGLITNQGVVRKNILLYNDSNQDIHVDSLYVPPYLEIVWDSAKLFKAKRVSEFTLFYHPERKNDFGYTMDNFVLFTNDKSFPEYHFSITATIRQYTPSITEINLDSIPKLYIDVASFQLLANLPNETHLSLSMQNIGKQNLMIYEIQTDENFELVSFNKSVLTPQDSATVVLKQIAKKNNVNDLIILFFTNDPVEPIKKVGLSLKK